MRAHARSNIRTNAEQFAETGNPWATRDDWIREEQLASNPLTPTAAKRSARSYTRRASMFATTAKPRPEHHDAPPTPSPDTLERRIARKSLAIAKRLKSTVIDPVETNEAASRFIRVSTDTDFAGIAAHPDALAAMRERENSTGWDNIRTEDKRESDWEKFLQRERAELAERRARQQQQNKA